MEKKSFCEWCVSIIAFVVRHLFPITCVKYWTRKENRYARHFVPSTNAQLRAIRLWDFSDEEVEARVWSKAAMHEIVKWPNRKIFINSLTAADEDLLDKICENRGYGVAARALKAAKPSKTYLKRLLFKGSYGPFIASSCLQLFNDFSMQELPDAKRVSLLKEFLILDTSKPENKATVVHWAQEVFNAYGDKPKTVLDEKQQELLKMAFNALRAMDYDMTDKLIALHNFQPELFEELSLNSKHIVAYLCELLPKMAQQYWLAENSKSTDANKQDSKKAQKWLQKAKDNIAKPEVQKVLLTDSECKAELLSPWGIWSDIRDALFIAVSDFDCVKLAMQLSPDDYQNELERKLVMAVKNSAQADEAMALVDKKYVSELYRKMVQFLQPWNLPLMLRHYPFNKEGWSPELRGSALKWLVEQNALPTGRIGELSDDMQAFVKEKAAIKSEIEGLRNPDTAEELINYRLHAETEKNLFLIDYLRMKDLAPLYVQKNRMADESFYALVHTRTIGCNNVEDDFSRLIELHATMHGLNERNLMDLEQSPYYSHLASMLRIYPRKSA